MASMNEIDHRHGGHFPDIDIQARQSPAEPSTDTVAIYWSLTAWTLLDLPCDRQTGITDRGYDGLLTQKLISLLNYGWEHLTQYVISYSKITDDSLSTDFLISIKSIEDDWYLIIDSHREWHLIRRRISVQNKITWWRGLAAVASVLSLRRTREHWGAWLRVRLPTKPQVRLRHANHSPLPKHVFLLTYIYTYTQCTIYHALYKEPRERRTITRASIACVANLWGWSSASSWNWSPL